MNKYFKYSFLSLFTALSLASCTNENEYVAAVPESEANPENNQVYFPIDSIREKYTLDGSKNSLELIVCRIDTTAEKTIRIEAEGDSLVSVPKTLTFAAGEAKATLSVAYNAETLGYDNPQTVTIWIADSTQTTNYGMSKYQFKINLPAPWTPWTSTKKDWVAAGYDAEDWPLSEDASTCTYTYGNIFSGDDTELPISYRLNLQDPEVAQIKIDNWCYGVSLVLDYNPQTKQIRIPMQTSGYIDESLGEFFITDVSGWQGKDYTASYPCYYDPETGLIVLNSAWVLADMTCYGYGVETIQLDGFYIPDYSVDAEYLGIFTSPEQKPFAQINVKSIGVDAEKAVALIVTAEDDAAAVADALAAGEVTGTDVVAGYNNIAIEEGMTGELQVVICSVLEGAAMDVKVFKFEYYGGGANPWQSIGTGYFTDDIIAPLYNVAPPTYKVEILANEELPGIYRVMNPYSNSVYPYAEDDCAPEGLYLEVNAADPEGVYIQTQSLGFDWGDGEFGFVSEGASYMGDYDFETIKKAGLFGTLQEGVIKFPVFTTKQGVNYQGYVTLDGKLSYYAGMNGKVEITLPTSNAFAQNMAKAKAKVSATNAKKGNFCGVKAETKMKKLLGETVEFLN